MELHDRQARILQFLRHGKLATVNELSLWLGVSKMTVRRDLEVLEAMGLLLRQHGGARFLPERGETEWPLDLRRRDHAEEKRLIGRAAARLIGDGDVVIIDGGSTALEVVRSLNQSHLTVVTNSLPAMAELATKPNIRLLAIGGLFHAENQTFIGPLAVEALSSLNVNVAILGTTNLSLERGLSIRSLEEAMVQRAKMEAATRTILVMDSSKMHKHTLATISPLDKIETLVTDGGLSELDRREIEALGVRVIVAADE